MERLINLGGLILVQKISNTCATTLKSTSLAVDRGDSKFYWHSGLLALAIFVFF